MIKMSGENMGLSILVLVGLTPFGTKNCSLEIVGMTSMLNTVVLHLG